MTPDATTSSSISTPAPQAAAPGSQPAPRPQSASPAAPPAPPPVQIFWEVAVLAFELMRRLVGVLQPIQSYYPKQAWQLARLMIDIPRILLTIRYAPERITTAQLRHLTRARHILQSLFNYKLPNNLGTPISRLASASATSRQSPSASTNSPAATPPGAHTSSASATTPPPTAPAVRETPAVAGVRQAPGMAPVREVPEIPLVAGLHARKTPSSASANTQSPAPQSASPTLNNEHLTAPPSHTSHSSQSPHSSFSPYIPDFHTLAQALKANSLPPNCAGALFDEPGDALVKILQQLHALYFSLYPKQPSPPMPSPSQSSGNLQSSISNLQSENPQSDPSPSTHNANNANFVNNASNTHDVHSVHPDSPIPHSTAPP